MKAHAHAALAAALALAGAGLIAQPAEAQQRGVNVGGPATTGTYARGPASYGGDPADYRNVPVGQPNSSQSVNGCYGGREQVRGPDGRLVWVPNVTCPYNPY
ncbi:MAG TPA: hypothetical protein VIL72_03860 [Beijerinckiaceae bacterium]